MLAIPKALSATAAVAVSVFLLVPAAAQRPTAGATDIAATLARLSIDLPKTITETAPVRAPLEQLGREKCDQDAIANLATALDTVGYRREAADAQVNFSAQCGGYAPALRGAVNTLLKLSDYTTAENITSDLIRLEPHGDNGYYLRALARDGNKSFKGAIDDYVTAIERFGNKDRISSVAYLKMSPITRSSANSAMRCCRSSSGLRSIRRGTNRARPRPSCPITPPRAPARRRRAAAPRPFRCPASAASSRCRWSSTPYPPLSSWIPAQARRSER